MCSAVDNKSGEKVAIKKINNVFDHVSDATRILREIKLLRLLRHPGAHTQSSLWRMTSANQLPVRHGCASSMHSRAGCVAMQRSRVRSPSITIADTQRPAPDEAHKQHSLLPLCCAPAHFVATHCLWCRAVPTAPVATCADIVEIKHIMLPPSPREFKDIYVVFELMETDLHQVRSRGIASAANGDQK